jgi:hypothetical protein
MEQKPSPTGVSTKNFLAHVSESFRLSWMQVLTDSLSHFSNS